MRWVLGAYGGGRQGEDAGLRGVSGVWLRVRGKEEEGNLPCPSPLGGVNTVT